jgi:D-3-phosphoglycerate dehydrogenase
MARVLVSEKIADEGARRAARRGPRGGRAARLSPGELLEAVKGAHALIIRSATTVTAEVLDAGTDLVVVGRAGIGLDNVDVAHATKPRRHGGERAAEQHPLGRRADDGAAARPGPQHPPGPRRPGQGRWERSKWEGVELADKTLAVIGLGRIGKLVAQRAMAFGMRIIAHDPFVSPTGPRP